MPRILVAVERAGARRALADALRAARYQVETCPEPTAAFECACRLQPELVILEVSASRHRAGCQALDRLKQQEETQAIPVLLTSPLAPALEPERRTLVQRGVHLLPPSLQPGEVSAWVEGLVGPPRS